MDTDSFVIHIETKDFYKYIANDVNKWFDTSKYNKNDYRPLPIGINKKVIDKFKDELKGKIMREFITLSPKVYAFTIDGYYNEDYAREAIINIKLKEQRRVIKKTITIDDYKKALLNNKKIRRTQQRFTSDHHTINTVNNNKIALNNYDDNRLQTFDGITTYQYGTHAFKVCKLEMLIALKNKFNANNLCDTEMRAKLKNRPIAMYY